MINTFELKDGVVWIIHDEDGDLMDYHFDTLAGAVEYINELVNEECLDARGKTLGDVSYDDLVDLGFKFTPLDSGEKKQDPIKWT